MYSCEILNQSIYFKTHSTKNKPNRVNKYLIIGHVVRYKINVAWLY